MKENLIFIEKSQMQTLLIENNSEILTHNPNDFGKLPNISFIHLDSFNYNI